MPSKSAPSGVYHSALGIDRLDIEANAPVVIPANVTTIEPALHHRSLLLMSRQAAGHDGPND